MIVNWEKVIGLLFIGAGIGFALGLGFGMLREAHLIGSTLVGVGIGASIGVVGAVLTG